MKSITKQKNILLLCLFLINLLLSTLVIIYDKYWYIFIVILAPGSLINSINAILLMIIKISKFLKGKLIGKVKNTSNQNNTIENNPIENNQNQTNPKYIYILPCYNETEKELKNTINSILEQSNVESHSKLLVIICDGKINSESGKGLKTDKILTNIIFKDYIIESVEYVKAYKTWNYDYKNNCDEWNNLELHTGYIKELKFLIIIKPVNLGKRDSLTLVRRLCNYYNNTITMPENEFQFNVYLQYFTYELLFFIENVFNQSVQTNQTNQTNQINNIKLTNKILNEKPILYIIGTDADTILDNNCTIELISSITDTDNNTESKIVGVVGFVDIVKVWNPLVIYQYCEYLYAQCLKRQAQSIITKKVNCLSGCVQLIRVCKETCSNKILDEFNRLPEEEEHIFNHIRSYASEDRNHICLMFSLYPYVKTIQNLNAISYTSVPDTLIKFIRQRKRWCAGASCNDILLIFNNKHNKWERIESLINVAIFSLTIFIFIATILFFFAIVNHPSILMLQLSVIMLIPALYSLLIPLFIYNDGITLSKKLFNIMYYYIGFILYNTIGSILNIIIFGYSLYYLDDLNWNSKKIQNSDTNNNLEEKNNINFINIFKNIDIIKQKKTYKGFDIKKKIKCFKTAKCIISCGCKYVIEDDNEINNDAKEIKEAKEAKEVKEVKEVNNENIKKIDITYLWDNVMEDKDSKDIKNSNDESEYIELNSDIYNSSDDSEYIDVNDESCSNSENDDNVKIVKNDENETIISNEKIIKNKKNIIYSYV